MRAKQSDRRDLEEAVEKVVAGPERKSRRLSDEEKRRVAYHETGHALVAAYCKYADVLHKISVVPHGRAALGYTLQLPEQDRYLAVRSELIDRIKGLLGGRAAEEVVFSEVSTGSGKRPGARHRHRPPDGLHLWHERRCGPGPLVQQPGRIPSRAIATASCSAIAASRPREVDEEVKGFSTRPTPTRSKILRDHRDKLDLVAGELLAARDDGCGNVQEADRQTGHRVTRHRMEP